MMERKDLRTYTLAWFTILYLLAFSELSAEGFGIRPTGTQVKV